MKRVIIIIFSHVAINTAVCQVNLVPNPSFEDYSSCPTGLGNFSVLNWTNPTLASPDYFNSCNSGSVGVPQNGFGYQNARTGYAYVGGHTSDFTATDYREYFQCQLDSALTEGATYEVSFYVSRTDSCKKACDNIGAYLSSNPISASNNQNLPFTPQVLSDQNNPITDATNWIQIMDTITSFGGERYLTIGVFANNLNLNWINVTGGWEDEAHYYFDDVSVKRILISTLNESPSFTQFNIFPNPSHDNVQITSNEIIKNYKIYSPIGQLIKDETPFTHNINLDFSSQSKGIYFIEFKTQYSIFTKKIFIH
jgi:hypothetical protein